MYHFLFWFLKFIIFGIIGFVFETICCIVIDHKFSNRGFLTGPMIPIYAVGSLLLIWTLDPVKEYIWIVLLCASVITAILEYFTSYLLEKIFHNRWWDYSNMKYNLNGRICLLGILAFTIGTPLIIYFINPLIDRFLLSFSPKTLLIIGLIVFAIFVLDVIYSVVVAYNLRYRIIIVEDLKKEKLTKIPGVLEKMLRKRIAGMKKYPKRLLESFPYIMKNKEKEFAIMNNEYEHSKEKHLKMK